MLDLTNQRFGRLVAIKYIGSRNTNGMWLCQCDCGKQTVVYTLNIRKGRTKSCGCFRKISRRIHGESSGKNRTRTYNIWANMMDRCEWGGNKRSWILYGARGIKVCRRWHNYQNFLMDMGSAPENLTLDRKNNDGNYEPRNCQWATRKEQNLNRRNTKKVRFHRKIIPMMLLSERLGLSHKAVRARAVRRNNDYIAAYLSFGIKVEAV